MNVIINLAVRFWQVVAMVAAVLVIVALALKIASLAANADGQLPSPPLPIPDMPPRFNEPPVIGNQLGLIVHKSHGLFYEPGKGITAHQ